MARPGNIFRRLGLCMSTCQEHVTIVSFQCCETFLSLPIKLLKQINREIPTTLKVIPDEKTNTETTKKLGLLPHRTLLQQTCDMDELPQFCQCTSEKLVCFMFVYTLWMKTDSVGGTATSLFWVLFMQHPTVWMWHIQCRRSMSRYSLSCWAQTPSRPCCF